MSDIKKIINVPCIWSRFIIFPSQKITFLLNHYEYAEMLYQGDYKEVAVLFGSNNIKNIPNQIKQVGVLCAIEKKTYIDGRLRLDMKSLYRIKAINDMNKEIAKSDFFRADFEPLKDDYSGCNQESIGEFLKFIITQINENITNEEDKISVLVNVLVGNILSENSGGSIIGDLDFQDRLELEGLLKDPDNVYIFNKIVREWSKDPHELSKWIDMSMSGLVTMNTPGFNKLRAHILEEPAVIKRMEILVCDILSDLLIFINKAYMARKGLRKYTEKDENGNNGLNEIQEIKNNIDKSKMTNEARRVAERELSRLQYIRPESSEYGVIKDYLNRLLSIPWGIYTKDNFDVKNLQTVLNEDHFGLHQVKDRILEHMAVQQLNPNKRGTILCFVGPPGTGKTSIAHSIGRALGRKIIRISLGSVRDEAEIKGHRRTYVGAIPGRIVDGIIKAESQNPLFILDEIDKLCRDYRGDPAAALLEALDPEQNFNFSDHYIEIGLDLSKVLFITTANDLDTIHPALLDRMEIIRFSTYTSEEKKEIAKKYLIPKQIKENGIEEYHIEFSDDAIMNIIKEYIRESGVRKLERGIMKICRKIAKKITSGDLKLKEYKITAGNLKNYIGNPKYRSTDLIDMKPGNAVGLAWTLYGGEILHIEAEGTINRGEKYIITGLLGDVMIESIYVIITFLQKNQKALRIPKIHFEEDRGMHIHIPCGAMPKDGPSAGITICAAMYSLFVNKALRKNVAFTGEITLKGRVLPVGGLKEKVLAARETGINKIFLPKDNEVDIDELENYVKEGIEFIFVSDMLEILIDYAKDIFESVKTYP